MKEHNVSICGFVEINRSINDMSGYKWIQAIRKWHYYSRFAHSESNINFESNYKPGGTITIIMNKWQSRVTEKGSDATNLGRWSYIVLSTNKIKLTIITAYRPCKTNGPSTAWTQQWTLLREKGHQFPDPIKQFYEDLRNFIVPRTQAGHEVILMIDANEHIGEKPSTLTQLLKDTGLSDIITHRHQDNNPPSTYSRGSKRIDYALGTRRVCQHVSSCGILPLGWGYQSDHRSTFFKMNLAKFFGSSVQALEHPSSRLIRNATPKERNEFLMHLHEHYNAHNLYQCFEKLSQIEAGQWTPEDQHEYEKCDDQHIKGMLSAEKKTAKLKHFDWSPKFQQATSHRAFWHIFMSIRLTQKTPDDKFLSWASSMGISDSAAFPIQEIK